MIDKEFAQLVQLHANFVKLVEYYSRKFDGRYSVGSKNKKVLDYYKLKVKELQQFLEQLIVEKREA